MATRRMAAGGRQAQGAPNHHPPGQPLQAATPRTPRTYTGADFARDRIALGFSKTKLADRMGITRQTVHIIEQASRVSRLHELAMSALLGMRDEGML